jgi:hypothetical protein
MVSHAVSVIARLTGVRSSRPLHPALGKYSITIR